MTLLITIDSMSRGTILYRPKKKSNIRQILEEYVHGFLWKMINRWMVHTDQLS